MNVRTSLPVENTYLVGFIFIRHDEEDEHDSDFYDRGDLGVVDSEKRCPS
jgi:hypothetical protein